MAEWKKVEEERLHRPGFNGYSNEKKWETLNGLLKDAVDTHINNGQDFTGDPLRITNPSDRPYDDVNIGKKATEEGMKAIVFTCHVIPAFARAPLIQKVVNDWAEKCNLHPVKIVGSVTLNTPMGGLNPEIVKMMARFGGKVLCLPSYDGVVTRQRGGLEGGIEVVKNGKVVPALEEIIGIAAESDMTIDISMVTPEERMIIFEHAKNVGVKGFYAFNPVMRGTEEHWVELTKKGVKLACVHGWMRGIFDQGLELMKKVGVENCVCGSDLNNWPNPHPVDGLKIIAAKLMIGGFSESDLEKIYKENPAKLLNL